MDVQIVTFGLRGEEKHNVVVAGERPNFEDGDDFVDVQVTFPCRRLADALALKTALLAADAAPIAHEFAVLG